MEINISFSNELLWKLINIFEWNFVGLNKYIWNNFY